MNLQRGQDASQTMNDDPLTTIAAQYDREDRVSDGPHDEPVSAPHQGISERAGEQQPVEPEDVDNGEEPAAEPEQAVIAEQDPMPAELVEQLHPHVERATQKTRQALRERFGEHLAPTMKAANRTLARFGSPQLRAIFKNNPSLAHPDLVDMFAKVDGALRQHSSSAARGRSGAS